MSVTAIRRDIPTVAQAVERFVSKCQQQRGVKEHISTLRGPKTGRVTGKKAAGPTLANSELGPLRFDRVSGDQFAAWLFTRHPNTQAASTRKKGRSSLRRFLVFAIDSGWAENTVLAALPSATASPPREEWLRPEQLVALDALVTKAEFDAGQRFMWRTLVNTGMRTAEVVALRPRALNPTDGTLSVLGKGRGDGKLRTIPISVEFQQDWQAFVMSKRLRPDGVMFPRMRVVFSEGARFSTVREVVDTRTPCTAKAARTVLAKVQTLAIEAAAKGELAPELLPQFSLTPKVLRRTFACSNLIAAETLGASEGMDLSSLQAALGHKSLETTAMYITNVAPYMARLHRPVSVVGAARRVVEVAVQAEQGYGVALVA
jgi:site-specific recombinase XerD